MNDKSSDSLPNATITYCLAHCEAKITEIARDSNESESELREWVGILLLTKGTGTLNNLSTLRGSSTEVHKTVRKVALARNSHQHQTPNKSKTGLKGRKFKPGTHWTQKPENKAKLLKITRARHPKVA